MQTEQVQQAPNPALKLRAKSAKAAGTSGTQSDKTTVSGDAFAMLFEMLAQSMQQNGMTQATLQGTNEPAVNGVQAGANLLSGTNANGMDAALQSLLAQNPQLSAFLQGNAAAAQQMLAQLQLPQDAQQALLNLRQQLLAATQQSGVQQAAVQQQTAAQTQPASTLAAAAAVPFAGSNTKSAATDDSSTAVVSMTGDSASAGVQKDTQPLQAANQFVQNVREAKKLMNETQKPRQTTDTVDVDALQDHAQAARPALNTSALRAANQLPQQLSNLSQQIKTGVAEGLLKGKQEFVIKLKPEGLGEITVKLTEKAGEATTLRLITANVDTAKLINADLDSLKEAMKPLQVVVESAQSQQTNNSGYGQTDQQAAQQQQFNAFAQQQGRHGSSHHYTSPAFFAEPDAAEEQPAPVQENTALDSYI